MNKTAFAKRMFHQLLSDPDSESVRKNTLSTSLFTENQTYKYTDRIFMCRCFLRSLLLPVIQPAGGDLPSAPAAVSSLGKLLHHRLVQRVAGRGVAVRGQQVSGGHPGPGLRRRGTAGHRDRVPADSAVRVRLFGQVPG